MFNLFEWMLHENRSYLRISVPVIALHVHLAGAEIVILLLFERIVPASELMVHIAAESLLELVKAIHRV